MSIGYSCFDVDECDAKQIDTGQIEQSLTNQVPGGHCPRYSECINTYGSYECACFPGFTAYNNSCQDVNECLHGAHCPVNSTCINTLGEYDCVCDKGRSQFKKKCTTAAAGTSAHRTLSDQLNKNENQT